jgi:hypothetical protein
MLPPFFHPKYFYSEIRNEKEIRVARFFCSKHTKLGKNTPNDHKLYQTAINYTKWQLNIPNGRKIFQMVIEYTNLCHSKALQNLPKVGFLV